MYITLTGLINSIVPSSGPWSILRKSLSYIVKLAPILWWALPSGQWAVCPQVLRTLLQDGSLAYNQSYGTARLLTTCAIGAYYSLSLFFRKLLSSSPAVVLENESYDLMIGTHFL
ncbi:hypothetical protein DSO57_1037340 [Entomophthora muscae]|uniref:Uncharacterized protein n=1 Tax=Entomophthora muscae TaxID=34485 RepID=A0ACC2SBQ5_9FUNG|nr:hypothetical protein DSO57_1037340 [Entomophthora muscae]